MVWGSREPPPLAGDCPGICWSLSHTAVRGADGLDWPPDPLRDDNSRSFDSAWRLDPKRHTASAPLVIRDLPPVPGARLGVRNHGPGYHAPVRAYTVEVAAGDGQQTGHLDMYA